ncbi:NAD(P)H-dependent oxidoreductase [Pedobacter sp. AW1-32]|uniref:NAD(P)H-dependent oxidoreductase n=1 Tax=Pedobacter sp. AW1-32 TaxID=3383026 RepID=UPI003FEF98A4
MKTLIVVIHPDMEQSVVNKRWVDELKQYPDQFLIHDLHQVYPDEIIDVAAEQRLIEAHDKIVFQFPFYWFSCPGFYKKWMDLVLTHGWAYGSKSGYKMGGKTVALAVSIGVDEAEYSAKGDYKYTLNELLRPFELSFEYVKADYRTPFAYYGMEYNSTPEWIEKSVPLYLDYLNAL